MVEKLFECPSCLTERSFTDTENTDTENGGYPLIVCNCCGEYLTVTYETTLFLYVRRITPREWLPFPNDQKAVARQFRTQASNPELRTIKK